MNCNNCNYTNVSSANYCGKCGARISEPNPSNYSKQTHNYPNQPPTRSIGPREAVQLGFSGYANFSNRSTRAEFWWFLLFYIVAASVSLILDGIIFGVPGLFYAISLLGLIIPHLAVTVRRLHDTNKSGWWILIGLIPFGGIVLLVMYLLPSDPYPNQYEYHSR
jgi:uncharacterized membrane protein YhaH (DUF805 family)